MDKYFDVLTRIIELSKTIEEGLLHIEKKLMEGCIEDTMYLMYDIIEGFTVIQESVQPINLEIPLEQLETLSQTVNKDLNFLVEVYQNKDINRANYILPLLLNDYQNWKNELYNMYGKYIGN